MKINDFIFQAIGKSAYRRGGIYRVRTFIGKQNEVVAIITDLDSKNIGPSVTNSIETIISDLHGKGLVPQQTIFVEHYDYSYPRGGEFSIVELDTNGQPHWKRFDIDLICSLVDVEATEFYTPSLEIERLHDEIERIRHNVSPHIDEPWKEPFEVINRREDIQKNMISIDVIKKAIENNAIEADLQKIIKSDLSILGDFYSYPSEEYICFSEFKIDDGYVDFVVFSGRSRMDVTLIEIKGANYNLINDNNYHDFSAKSNQAVQQIRKRLGFTTRNYETFRKYVHEIRKIVEDGGDIYNSFVGPKGKLEVDPNKDIDIHTVVIGGKSKNDLIESKLRHEYQINTSPPIKIESWDSWIKKSRRT